VDEEGMAIRAFGCGRTRRKAFVNLLVFDVLLKAKIEALR
jgi:hypothetical protein